MEQTLFAHVLAGIVDNNNINDARFSDWDDAEHAIDTYASSFNGECSEDEKQLTIKLLDQIINSDGGELEAAVTEWNQTIWGANFSNNEGVKAV